MFGHIIDIIDDNTYFIDLSNWTEEKVWSVADQKLNYHYTKKYSKKLDEAIEHRQTCKTNDETLLVRDVVMYL